MALSFTSYFGLIRISDMGPEAKGWAVTDLNPEIVSLLIKAVTGHKHGAATPMKYPGYNYATPATPLSVTLTEVSNTSTGVLNPGTSIGVRLAYLNNLGLETDASPEQVITLSAIPIQPNAPSLTSAVSTPVGGALGGGTYVYVLTKGQGAGETQPSAISAVDVPFSTDTTTSYVVPVAFDAFSSYGDSTDALYLYRATGLTSSYKLIKSFTDSNAASYTDDGSYENADRNPPTVNTFGKNKLATIDWTAFSHPSDAVNFNIYVTQQPGVYGINHLLASYAVSDLLATPSINYLGSETLSFGYPKDFSQLPDSPDKVVLSTEATGAPILTTSQDFQGYQAKNFVFSDQNTTTPINGNAYLDSSSNQFKIRINGSYVTLATPASSFVHSATEPGGHNATNILYGSQTMDTVAGIIANSVAGQIRKQVQSIILATPSTNSYITNSTAATPLLEMENLTNPLTPAFAGQIAEITFSGHFLLNPKGLAQATGTVFMQIGGNNSLGDVTIRSFTAPATPTHVPVHISYSTPISSPLRVRVMWLTSGGELTSVAGRRQLRLKGEF